MTCRLCKEKILEYLYDELNEDDRRLMERHLESSASCREQYRIFQSVRNIAAEDSDADFPQALHTRIMAHASEAKSPMGWRTAWARRFRPALATTLVAVAAVGLYFHASRIQGPLLKKQAVMMEESPDDSLNEVRMARSVKDKKISPLKKREATGTFDLPVPGNTMKTDMSGPPEKTAVTVSRAAEGTSRTKSPAPLPAQKPKLDAHPVSDEIFRTKSPAPLPAQKPILDTDPVYEEISRTLAPAPLPAHPSGSAEKKEGGGAGEERFREIPEEAVPVYAKRKASSAPDMEAADSLGKTSFSSQTHPPLETVWLQVQFHHLEWLP